LGRTTNITTLSKKINVFAPINDLGYGIASKNIIRGIHNSETEISLFSIGPPQLSSEEEATFFGQFANNQSTFDANAPCLKIWHEHSMAERIGRGKFFGFPFFEIDKFNERRKIHLNSCDSIIVASQWAKEIIEDQVPNKEVHVVPLGVDASIFSAKTPVRTDKCIFFNCGKWEVRKGHDLLLHFFKEAFPYEDDVELWMMCSNPFLRPEESQRWEGFYKQDPRVKIIGRVESQNELAEIMRSTSCGIFPSRAEGWNLEILEMMALGKHIITTNYSAHKEFCTEENSFLINPLKKEPAVDGKWFDGEGEWASLDGIEEEFMKHMKKFYLMWKDSKEPITNEQGIKTTDDFSWNATGKKLLEIICENKSKKASS